MKRLLLLFAIAASGWAQISSFPPASSNGTGGTGNAASVVTTTFSATPTFTCPSSSAGTVTLFKLSTTLTANITGSTLASCTAGQEIDFLFTQDGTGSRTVSWPTGFGSAPIMTPLALASEMFSFKWDGTNANYAGGAIYTGPNVCQEQAAPGVNPPAGSTFTWCDSTDHIVKGLNSSGTNFNTVVAKASRTANQFVTNIPTTGIQTTAAIVAADIPSNIRIRQFGTTFGDTAGSALTSGSIVYFTVAYACTISAWNATVDAGTVTFDVWKIATATVIPTVTNTITASALPAIASGTALHSTTLTGWTTTVSANDIFGIQLKTVATAKYAELDLECDQ